MEGRPPPPFPQRFQKSIQDFEFKKFLDILKQLHINILLVEVLKQMPNYLKFMKYSLSKKKRLRDLETFALTERCTTMLRNKLPPKLKDLGSFTIPCSIGNHYVGKALCALDTSINLMPMSVFRKLEIRKARHTIVTLQLLDCSYVHPEGKIEDVLVGVDKFIFLVDFIILECEANKEVPIIFGRYFLAIRRTLIDVQKDKLTMIVNDQQITFNVFDDMKCVDIDEECRAVEIVDIIVQEEIAVCYHNNCNDDANLIELIEAEMIEELSELMDVKQIENGVRRSLESLNLVDRSFKPPRPSIEDHPLLELKPLPAHLKYAYLGDSNTLLIIIFVALTVDQEA
ncbi:uncharacterized protein LOC108488271 [Gossypium arboreum]|uniref:uncharacterized protein LOC108488271 n=1 Tax=Gossypium arboreum TaxID=29729 RepID=UPI0008192A2A|nr:uncharacterized protein LOC108488271 [Gossypium arboreum]